MENNCNEQWMLDHNSEVLYEGNYALWTAVWPSYTTIQHTHIMDSHDYTPTPYMH